MRLPLSAALGLALLASACGKSPASPTTTTAAPTATETFVGTLAVGTFRFYSFSIGQNGTVNITLASLEGADVPADVTVGLGIGSPNGRDCTATNATITGSGATAQLTGVYPPGVYCTRVYDVGNLPGPATFSITIAHP